MSDSVRPHWRQPTKLPCPWDSPGKNTEVGCRFLLQCMKVKVKSLSHVLLLATPWTAADQAPPSMGFSRQEYWSGVPLPSPSNISKHYSKPVMCAQFLWPNLAQPYERNSALTSECEGFLAWLLSWNEGKVTKSWNRCGSLNTAWQKTSNGRKRNSAREVLVWVWGTTPT